MDGRTVLITGATDGLGRALAADLAGRGARVLVHGRDPGRVSDAAREVGAAGSYVADLASLAEVRRFAGEVAGDHEALHVLVNNAGIGSTLPGDGVRMESADGYELRFAVNYLAGFLLTRLLEPTLVAGAPGARVVNVASAGQWPIDFDDVMLERSYDGSRAYAQSKLAQVMFTFDLAERLRDAGVTANALHPSTYMPTKMVLHARGAGVDSLEGGVAATARLAADPELDGMTGRYFNRTREARADDQAYDADARRRLWELSERLTGLRWAGATATTMARMADVTVAEEEYLQTLFWLQEAGLPMTGANVARAMQLSPPTVHEMVGRLERDGYITRAGDKSISFTDSGQGHAEGIVRRHRLIERFLTDVLGIPWDEVHEEAERLEHAMSPVLEERMLAAIGDAKTCPHGHPIVAGTRIQGVPLADVEDGASIKVLRFENEAEELLHYLKTTGLEPGLEGTVAGRDDGGVLVQAGDRTITVDGTIAETVSVVADPSPPPRVALPEQLVISRDRYGR